MRIISSVIRSFGVAALVFGSLGGFAHAAPSTVYVSKTNCSDSAKGAGSARRPYCTIQKAVKNVVGGGTVRVAAGTYSESVVINRPLNLYGAQFNREVNSNRTDLAKESIVTGTIGSTFTLNADNITINGFTLSGNKDGPAIMTDKSHSKYRIHHNIIRNNVYGIYLGSTDKFLSSITRNRFEDNNQTGSASGNGIYADSGASNVTISRNTFISHANSALTFVSTSSNIRNSRLNISHNTTNGPGSFLILINGHDSSFKHNTGTGFKASNAVLLGGSNDKITFNQNSLAGDTSGGTKNALSAFRVTLDQKRYGNPDFTLVPNSSVTISQNKLTDFGNAGISIGNSEQPGLTTLVNSTVSQNIIANNGGGNVENDGGILVRSGNIGLMINRNTLKGNLPYGAADYTSGAGTSDTGNTWPENICTTSTPQGICAPATSSEAEL